MIKNFMIKMIYNIYYTSFILSERFINDHKKKSKIAENFLLFNNKRVLRKIKNKKLEKISILLPHCIQKYDCPYKVTSNIENCKQCGGCKLGDILKLKKEFNVDVKVATGGTLARMYIKDYRPDLLIAVACKRDLVSGIYDAFPFKVYGIFNEIKNSPCINTDVSLIKIREFLEEVRGRK
ncbi:hypothetical protein SAMN02745174_00212 [Cetobacterium ceti]|uniref:DUF116 domain-containing protein n=1 Tax=Cetobacterium ceti TaxID=180163 RepID=A0A1T4JZU2_9FUSO|nr:hypothetical protein SAMN02745174_00212 [Cetobacterium ceti]